MKGSFHIGRYSNSDTVEIRVIDDASRTHFLILTTDILSFANALFGRGECECVFELCAKYLGKVRQHKTVEIPLPKSGYAMTDPEKELVLLDYEKDGWVGDRKDLDNGHRYHDRGGVYSCDVTFTRYVEPEAQQ